MASSQAFSRATVRRVNGGPVEEQFDDLLAVEEPLEIRLGFRWEGKPTHRAISITMRTPGEDADLAAGFLFTEGILRSPDEILQIHHCGLKIGSGKGTIERASALNSNTIRVDLRDDIAVDLKRLERHFYTSSSCGVCGKGSIEAVGTGVEKLPETGFVVRRDVIHQLPEQLRRAQSVFDETGGLHASGLFTADGQLDVICEDVGRHNALDKVIGGKFLAGDVPVSDRILMVSGRASFELVQKALMAGIPILVAVGAPSSLAVELAREFGLTLIGFVRDGRFNIYTGGERIKTQSISPH